MVQRRCSLAGETLIPMLRRAAVPMLVLALFTCLYCLFEVGHQSRKNRADSSGGVGLIKNPVPHSNPATRVNFGMISTCQ